MKKILLIFSLVFLLAAPSAAAEEGESAAPAGEASQTAPDPAKKPFKAKGLGKMGPSKNNPYDKKQYNTTSRKEARQAGKAEALQEKNSAKKNHKDARAQR